MANRKVLINRHTSGSTAPNAAEMFHGEIAVAHETGKETLWTKNNANEMVPFISCAQTIAIIDSKVQASEDSVVAKAGEEHIEVESAGTVDATIWQISSKDVQSEEEFKAYSANTKTRIDNNYSAITAVTEAVSDLINITVTGISGDTIIVAEPVDNGTGSNAYNLTHKQALATDGFKKLTTDAYGHVTAATDVTTADIQALGFKTSAETGEDLAELSGAVIANETHISELSGGTIHDIETLSGDVVEYVKVVSGNIETVINELSAGTIQLSADTHNTIVKLSGDTEAAIAAAIDGLDSNSATTDNRHYVTAITIEDGKIVSFGEATDPQLSVESAGTGNVVSQITVQDHKITYQTASVATSEGIAALSASVINLSAVTGEFSGATNTRINDLSAYTEAVDDKVEKLSAATISISGFAHGEIAQLSGATVAEFTSAFTAIQGMDKAADAEDGKVVTTVAQEDGKVTETKANVKDLQLGGYVKDTTATGDIESADTINAALSKLENKANAITIANADKSINVTTGATGTDINVNIKSGEHVLAKDGNAGLYTDIKLSGVTPSSDLVKEEYVLYGTDNTVLGDHIKIYKDQSLVSITLEDNDGSGHTGQYLKYTYIDASGATQSTYVNVSSFLVEAEFMSGVTADASGVVHGVVDSTSEKDSNNDSFLTVGADGFKVDGIKDEIDAKIAALDVTGDTAVAGQYVAAIEQTDGVVAVKTRANVSEAVLTNYAKGSDSSAVAATDTVNQAVSKLENQIDAAKAAATTKVVEGTDAGNNMTITPTTGADGSVTYTVDLTDVASATALTAEIAARKAVDGQNGDTYAANAGTNFISDATSLNDADVKLDTAIKTLSGNAHDAMIARDDAVFSSAVTYVDEVYASGVSYTDAKVAAEIALLDSVGSASTTGHYLTSVTITDGKITAVGEVAVPAAVAITATTGTAVDTPSAVLTGVTADGNDNHNLTFGMSNKVFSAATSDSAVTSQSAITSLSAQTSVSANMAYEVSSAATITSGQVTDFVEGVQNIKVNSAYTAESADTAAQVAQSLTMTDGANTQTYNGSEAKSLTFGTATSISGEKSMTMTNAGVVDVNVIDCGEY